MNLLTLLTHVVFWPVSGPLYLARFAVGRVEDVVREELTDAGRIKAALIELQLELELGDIDQEEYDAREAELLQQLREVREWREHFGMSVAGGVVRMQSQVRVQSATEADTGAGEAEPEPGAIDSDSVIHIELNLDHD